MRRLAPFALLPLAAVLPSCGLANKLIQPPVRLIQAAGRTVTADLGDPTPPATTEASRVQGIALRITLPDPE